MAFEVMFEHVPPAGTCVAVSLPEGDDFAPPPALHPDEAAFVHASPAARRATFMGGRVAMRAALSALGADAAATGLPILSKAYYTKQTFDETSMEPPLGSGPYKVGKFEVNRPLGQGGQAMTFLAFDPDLKRHVVLKLYHAARTGAAGETVLHEGQALARVRSPYVA